MKLFLLSILIVATFAADQNTISPQIVNHVDQQQDQQRFAQTEQFQGGPSGANYPHTVQMPAGTVYNQNWQPIGNSQQMPRLAECPCAGQGCPGGCSNGQNVLQCSCAPEAACPPCIIAKSMKQMHEMAANNAEADAATQVELFEQSDLEKKLFEQAQKYAAEAAEEEKLAREAAAVLQEHASKAQIARNKMIRAENQAKQIAMKTLNTMTIHPPHTAVGVPGMSVKQIGITQQTVSQATPQYQLHINPTDASGFHDMIGSEINDAVAMNEKSSSSQPEGKLDDNNAAPDNLQEATLQNEVFASGQTDETRR